MVAGFNVLRVLMQKFITISGYGGNRPCLKSFDGAALPPSMNQVGVS